MKYTKLLELFNQQRGIVSPCNNTLSSLLLELLQGNLLSFPSGSCCNSWKIPHSWQLESATFKTPYHTYRSRDYPLMVPFGTESFEFKGKLIDFRSNLLFDENHPDLIKYSTNYYTPERRIISLPYSWIADIRDSEFIEVSVESSSSPDSMKIVETFLPGSSSHEILITTYCCHPGLGNDNFSGLIGLCELYDRLKSKNKRFYNYRFAVFPETIGAIFYINHLLDNNLLNRVLTHVNLSCLGGALDNYSFKRSYYDSPYCREFEKFVASEIPNVKCLNYFPTGSDERQFSSPSVRIPSVSLCKNRYYEYFEYHTSYDDLTYMNLPSVIKTSDLIFKSLNHLDSTLRVPIVRNEIGEPHLNHYQISFHDGGLYRPSSDDSSLSPKELFFLVYSMCDGSLSTSEISSKLMIEHGTTIADTNHVLSMLTSNKIVSF